MELKLPGSRLQEVMQPPWLAQLLNGKSATLPL